MKENSHALTEVSLVGRGASLMKLNEITPSTTTPHERRPPRHV